MARKNRIKLPNDRATYHVSTQTAHGVFHFEDPRVREWIYQRILAIAKGYFVEMHSIVIMSNHYHLVFSIRKPDLKVEDIRRRFEHLQSLNKRPCSWNDHQTETWYHRLTDLSEFMKAINESIARKVNKLKKCSGHLWGKRFFSSAIEDGPGLLACIAYTELNPVRAGMCQKPSDYSWSSVGRFSRGGRKTSGVTVPRLSAFAQITPKYHQQALATLVDHIAMREQGEDSQLPQTYEAWEKQLSKFDLDKMAERCLRRTQWAMRSLVLGSATFCKNLILDFNLQKLKPSGPKVHHLFDGICNCKERNGLFAQ